MTGTSGTMPKINESSRRKFRLVPSIAAQQKCIAFVNLAIKICSDLKIRLQTSQQTQLHLADAHRRRHQLTRPHKPIKRLNSRFIPITRNNPSLYPRRYFHSFSAGLSFYSLMICTGI
jgi:hypothetical protein